MILLINIPIPTPITRMEINTIGLTLLAPSILVYARVEKIIIKNGGNNFFFFIIFNL